MTDIQVPYDFTISINGQDWYMLAKTMAWLKGVDGQVQINPYKRRCSQANMIKHKDENSPGKPRVYVNRDGLAEIVERTPSVLLSYKRLLGVASGTTRNEHVFGSLLSGFFNEIGVSVERQVPLGDYRIDFIVGGTVAVEYDEQGHQSYCKKREELRSSEISRRYRLVRVSDSDNEGASIAKVLAIYNA